MRETAQAEGTARDFDFWMGRWNVHNRFLCERLAGSDEWDEFEATSVARPLLDGLGNEDEFRTDYRGGFVAMSFRLHRPSRSGKSSDSRRHRSQTASRCIVTRAEALSDRGSVHRQDHLSSSLALEDVFRSEGIRVLQTPVRAPKANAYAERSVRTVRARCLNWLLIVGRHLEQSSASSTTASVRIADSHSSRPELLNSRHSRAAPSSAANASGGLLRGEYSERQP